MKRTRKHGRIKKEQLQKWVGAFFFAAFLWLLVISERTYTDIIEVPIEVRNIKEGKTLGAEVVPTAQVRFRGTGRALFKTLVLKPISNLKLVLDLERISTEYDFHLNDYFREHPEKVVVPSGFEVDFISVVQPDSIHISLDDYMIKSVKVIPEVVVRPSDGFIQVGSLGLNPKNIELKGPKAIIMSVTSVKTKEQRFTELQQSLRAMVPLELNFPGVVEASRINVEISANIQSIGERIISEVPVQLQNVPSDLRVNPIPSEVSLSVTGGVDYIASLDASDIGVSLDFAQWRFDRLYYEPTVTVPEGVLQWRDLSPKNIELAVTRMPE